MDDVGARFFHPREQMDRNPITKQGLFHIVPCAVMLAVALLWSIMDLDHLPSTALALVVFSLAGVGFFTAHLETMKEWSHWTIPPAFIAMTLAGLLSGNPRHRILPFVPLVVLATGVVTLAVPRYLEFFKGQTRTTGHVRPSRRSPSVGCLSRAALVAGMERPSPCHSHGSSGVSGEGSLSLSDVSPRVRRGGEWDYATLTHFPATGDSYSVGDN